jgi:hypothetical protein
LCHKLYVQIELLNNASHKLFVSKILISVFHPTGHLSIPICHNLVDLWDSEVGRNTVGAAVLVVELANGLGRAVSSKLEYLV